MTVPRWRRTSDRPAPTAASSSQRSPHRVNDSTWDGDSRTASPPATIGPASDSSVSAYQSRGWAARTPAAASRASWAAAACRTAAGGRCRRRPGAGRRPGPAWTASDARRVPRDPLDRDVVASQLGQEPGRALVGVLAARGGDDQQPPGPGDRHVEQPAFLGQQLGGQHRGVHVRAAWSRRGPGRAASASSPAPSREPRSRRSGQVSSWTPATTTTSHSRPLDRCAVRIRTQSSRTARSASVSPTISCPARLSANRAGRARRHGVGEVRGLVEQGQHGVQVPVGGRAGRAARRAEPAATARASPEASQMAHSTSSALPPALMAAGPWPAARPPAGPGRPRCPGPRDRSRGSSRAAASRSPPGRRVWPEFAGSAGAASAQRAEGPAQAAQAEGVGAAERAAEQLGGGLLVELGRPQRAAQQHEQRPGARLVRQRQLVAGHRDRDARRGQRPAQQRHLPGRRAHQDRHRRPGHAVGQVRAAQRVGDQGRLLGGAVRDQDADLARRGPGRAPGRGGCRPDGARGAGGPRAAGGPPGGTRPAGPGRCGGRCAARSPARAGRPRCGTARGTRSARARRRRGTRRWTGPGRRPRSAPGRRRPARAAATPAPGRCPGTRRPAPRRRRRARAAWSPRGRAGRRRCGRSPRSRRPGPGPGRSGPRTGPGTRRPPSSRRGPAACRAGAGRGRPGRARPRAAAGRAPPRRSPGWPGRAAARSGQPAPPSWASPRSIRRTSSSCSGAESSRGGSSPASTNSRRASA